MIVSAGPAPGIRVRHALGRGRREDRVGVGEEDERRALPPFERSSYLHHLRGARMVDLGRDELGKREHAGLRLRRRERGVVALDDLVRKLCDGRDPDELAGNEVGTDPADEVTESQPLLRRSPARPNSGIEDHEPGDAIRALDREPQSDRPAPVLDDDGGIAQVELVGEALDRRKVEVVGVVLDPGRLVRAPEPEVVGRDGASGTRDGRDHLAIQERPGRLAVQEQHRIARALVDVVHPQPVLLDVVRLEVVAREPDELLIGRAVDLHAGQPMTGATAPPPRQLYLECGYVEARRAVSNGS